MALSYAACFRAVRETENVNPKSLVPLRGIPASAGILASEFPLYESFRFKRITSVKGNVRHAIQENSLGVEYPVAVN